METIWPGAQTQIYWKQEYDDVSDLCKEKHAYVLCAYCLYIWMEPRPVRIDEADALSTCFVQHCTCIPSVTGEGGRIGVGGWGKKGILRLL